MMDTPTRRETFHSASKLTHKYIFSSKSSGESSEDKTLSTRLGVSRTIKQVEAGKLRESRPWAAAIGVRFSKSDGKAVLRSGLSCARSLNLDIYTIKTNLTLTGSSENATRGLGWPYKSTERAIADNGPKRSSWAFVSVSA
jgi:hypothetical protein